MTASGGRRSGIVVAILVCIAFSGCVAAGGNGSEGPGTINLGAWGGPAKFVATLGDPSKSGTTWPGPFDAQPVVADLDGDGESEIITTTRDRQVRIYDADGALRAAMAMGLPPSWHIDQWLNGVAVGTLRPGGPATVVAATPAAGVIAWEWTGTNKDGSFSMTKLWERRLDDCHPRPGMDATPVLADVDGDGADEMFLQVEQVGLFGLNADGTTRWSQCWAGGNADAAVADLDGDGDMEVVFASDSGFIAVLDASIGKPQWTFDARAAPYRIEPASIPVQPTIAELDGKAPMEIVFTARYAPNNRASEFEDFHMAIFAVHQNLRTWQPEVLWMRQPTWAHPLSYTRIIAADVDQDGRTDLFGMDWNTIGHQPGNWEHLGDAHVFRLDADGEDVWVRPIESWWSNKDIAVGDFDGDGQAEVLANGAGNGGDGFVRLDAATGATEGFLSAGDLKLTKGPTIAPIRAGGPLHLVAPAGPLEGPGRGALLLYSLGVQGPIDLEGSP